MSSEVAGKRHAGVVRVLLLVGGLGVALFLSRRWPTDHTVHIVLGDSAPQVEELRVRYAASSSARAHDWLREVSFHFVPGHAPRIVNHEPRLVSGVYDIEIDLGLAGAPPHPHAPVTLTVDRRVDLAEDTVSVDVSAAVRDSLEAP